jgi:hypothetical protein
MKRFKTLIGLAFAALIGSFAMSAPAHASTVTLGGVTCNNNNSTFPHGQFWYCTPGGTQQGPMLTLMGNAGTDAESKFTTSNGQIYVFKNYADYFSFCGATGSPLACAAIVGTTGEWGDTITAASPVYSVVFEQMIVGGIGISNPALGATTMHEMGHQLDRLYGTALGSSGTGWVSGSTTFINELNNKAWPQFNLYVQCGNGGIFYAQTSASGATKGTYICSGTGGTGGSLNTGFSGNDENVLKTAQQNYFTDVKTPGAYSELWAETFASQTNGTKSGNANPQYYIKANGFACVVTEVNTMREYGRYPVPGEYPTYCR